MNKEKFDLLSKTIKLVLKEKPRINLIGKETALKKYRVNLNISGPEAARRLHMSYRHYNRLENQDEIPKYILLLIKQGAMIERTDDKTLTDWWKEQITNSR